MSLKTKLTSLITTFVLLCSLLTVGVFAVKNTSLVVGGDIEFVANGINANIKLTDNGLQGASLPTGVSAGTDVMNEIVLNDTKSKEDVESQFSKWSNLDLTFGESGVATIELSITNNSTTDYIDVILSVDEGTSENIKITAKNNDGSIQGLVYPETTETYTITFTVRDTEYQASAEGFTINFGLQKKTINDIPNYDAVEGLTFSCDTTAKTATLTDGTSATGEVVIPSYIQKDNVICAVTSVGNETFCVCDSITRITIPNTVTSIGYMAFWECSLTSITIPEGVTSIGYNAFYDCSGLTSITIPDGVTSIGYETFSGCSNLTSITIPSSVTSIEDGTFSDCSNLTSITIPASVTSIGEYAFSGCNKLTGDLVISKNVTTIGARAFAGTGFTSIVVESENSVYDSRNNCNAIIETATNKLITGCQNTIIPNTVTKIGDFAFSGCTSLTSITIPEGVTSIVYGTFSDCSNLTSITIPASVTSIGEYAFSGCDSLTTVNYRGTQEQWNAITIDQIDDGNFVLTTANINFNYTGE